MEERICKFCHESTSPPDNPLISPCECSGSLAHVHTTCLDEWRASSREAFVRCGICHAPYDLVPVSPLPTASRVASATRLCLELGGLLSALLVTILLLGAAVSAAELDAHIYAWVDEMKTSLGLEEPRGRRGRARGGSRRGSPVADDLGPIQDILEVLASGSLAFSLVGGIIGLVLVMTGVLEGPDLVNGRCRCFAFGFGGPMVLLVIAGALIYGLIVLALSAANLARSRLHAHRLRVYGTTNTHVVRDRSSQQPPPTHG